MYLTQNQVYLLSILKEVHWLRRDQVWRLLQLSEPWKTEVQTDAALRQLQFLGRIFSPAPGVFGLSDYLGQEPECKQLELMDVLLDLCGKSLVSLSTHRAPFPLCFLSTQTDGRIASFGLLPVAPGQELVLSQQAEVAGDHRTVIFLLEDWKQREKIRCRLTHYFALFQNGKHHYFKGGEAG